VSRAPAPRWSVRLLCLALLLALAVPVGIAAGPFVALYRIKAAVDSHDAGALAGLVAFDVLRPRLKARYAPAQDAAPGVIAAFKAALQARVVDTSVERLVTPAMLGRVLYGRRVWQAVRSEPAASLAGAAAAVSHVRFAFQGPTQFSLWISDDEGRESCLVLVLQGASWKIGDVVP
jgi:hypothetical protein